MSRASTNFSVRIKLFPSVFSRSASSLSAAEGGDFFCNWGKEGLNQANSLENYPPAHFWWPPGRLPEAAWTQQGACPLCWAHKRIAGIDSLPEQISFNYFWGFGFFLSPQETPLHHHWAPQTWSPLVQTGWWSRLGGGVRTSCLCLQTIIMLRSIEFVLISQKKVTSCQSQPWFCTKDHLVMGLYASFLVPQF